MAELKSIPLASLHGRDISVGEALHNLHLNGRLRILIQSALEDRALEEAIEREGITVTPDELQKAANAFRVSQRLHKTEDINSWLQSNRLTTDMFEQLLRGRIARQKFVAKLLKDQIEPFFSQNRDHFDRVALSRIIVEDEGVAEEIKSQISDDGSSFWALANEHSVEKQKGRVGIVRRKALPPSIESVVFAAKDGDVVGPVLFDGKQHLIKVARLLPGQLTRKTAKQIQDHLFRRWLRQQVATGNPQIRIFEQMTT